MQYRVLLTESARIDLEELIVHIELTNVEGRAKALLQKLRVKIGSLSTSPERGTFPKEILSLGIKEFREIYYKPYRIIYRVVDDAVYVMLISDGRRDMRTLLQRRLLED